VAEQVLVGLLGHLTTGGRRLQVAHERGRRQGGRWQRAGWAVGVAGWRTVTRAGWRMRRGWCAVGGRAGWRCRRRCPPRLSRRRWERLSRDGLMTAISDAGPALRLMTWRKASR
jgi:hypothetical protein